ncbi:toxin Cry1Ac domain D-VI-related protein [Carnobacterium maltaromaticum]|uniref:toxin Cry1Ac domain D-VI-related protein n=1 Tax=Carnobacterium maltaromaticum TaxID=2751 RepID=UPI00191BC928|nr:toxin Cry1Ac domain D-VI-related protein [Carnobacterium maltaromaticum]CAD5899704.1 exported hypothetical protein [Carnobacterium maltaromaticum]
MKMKKMKLLLLSSLVLSTLAQPIAVLATQLDNNSELQAKDSKARAVSNPNIMNISSKYYVSGTNWLGTPNRWMSTDWDQSTDINKVKGNKVGFSTVKTISGWQQFEWDKFYFGVYDNSAINMQADGGITRVNSFGVGQEVKTVIGKEYTFSTMYSFDGPSGELQINVDNKKINIAGGNPGSSGSRDVTFVATSTNTYIQFYYTNGGMSRYGVTLNNLKIVKSTSQVAIEELQQLLPTFFDKDGNLGDKITANDLSKAQALLNKIKAGTEKNKLQATFNQATELLNQRTALTAVSALFENNDVTSNAIKDTVTQTSLDNVKIIINKVGNTEKNTEFNTYLAKATEFFNQNVATKFVTDLFVDGNLENDAKENLSQKQIDQANELINKVTDEEIKSTLLQVSERLQNVLNERIEEQNNQKAANEAVNGLFKDGNPASEAIVDDLAQWSIDKAIELTDKVKEEEKKAALLSSISKAQTLLTARLEEEAKVSSIREAISALFQNDNVEGSIREDLTQEEINQVVILVETIKDSTIQTELSNQISKAQTELNALNVSKENDAESAVNGLFQNNDPSTAAIKGGLTQEMINAAKAYTNEVIDLELKAEFEANIALAQLLLDERIAETNRQNEAQKAVNALFVENNPGSGLIASDLTQEMIDKAQSLIDVVTLPSKKEALQTNLNTAQNLLTKRLEENARQKVAKEAVNALFENNDPATNMIVKELTQKEIDAAEILVDKVTDSAVKSILLANIVLAEELLEQRNIENGLIAAAEKEVNALFQENNPSSGVIVEGLTQAHIDATKVVVNKVQTEAKKAELLAQVELAQKELYKQIIEKENQKTATEAVNKLFKENDPVAGIIIDGLNQETINAAKELVALITNVDKKAELMGLVKLAQDGFNATLTEAENKAAAEKAVNELFKDNNPETGIIKDGLTQETIDYATELTAKVTNESEQKELMDLISIAQKELNNQVIEIEAQKVALDALNELYKNDTIESGTLKDSTTQVELDAVKELIENVTDVAKKEELQNLLADAQALFTEQLNEMLVVDKFTLGKDSYVTGKLNNDITSIKLTVNGTEFTGGTVSNGTFKFYAKGGKIKAVTDIVTITGFNKAGDPLVTKNVKVVDVMVGELTVEDFKVGPSTQLIGTFSEDIKSISVDVDGKIYRGGTLNSDGTFKFYFKGNVTNINQVAVISGFDADGYEIARTRINLLPQTPGQGYINPAPFVLTEDSHITGTYSYDVKTIEVFVDGVKYEGGTISGDGTFKFYARSIVKSTDQKVEIIAYGVDGVETGRNFIPVITPEIGSGTLAPDEVILGETRTITGAYTGDIASIRLVVDGVETRGGTVKDGLFTFYAAGKITKDSKDVKILGYDLRGNLLAEEVITVVDPNAVPEVKPDPEVTPDPEDNEEEETLPTEELPVEINE